MDVNQQPPPFADGMARMRLESVEDQMLDVNRTLYGNSKERNGGGLVGDVRRLRDEFDALRDASKRPQGWTTLIVVGGVASLLLHIITLAALITLISMVVSG